MSLLEALEQLDGELRVDSAPGQGTRCRVILPLVVERPGWMLVHPDAQGRRRILARWQRQGIGAVGVPHCRAAVQALSERPVSQVVLVRGLVDRRLPDLLGLVRAQKVGLEVCSVQNTSVWN